MAITSHERSGKAGFVVGTLGNVPSGLREWMLWAKVLFGSLVVAGVASAIGAEGPVLYVILGATVIGTIVRSYNDAVFLERETIIASEQIGQLEKVGDVGIFLVHAKESLFKSHIQCLYTIFKSHPIIEQDHLVEILHARLLARNRVVELFSSLLLTLGLVGTIVGLILMMSEMSSALTANVPDKEAAQVERAETATSLRDATKGRDNSRDSAARANNEGLVQRLRKPLTKLSLAFNTTLIGAIFGGVILRILNSVVDAAITRYVAHVAELTEVHVLPIMRRVADKMRQNGYYSNLDTPTL